MYGSCSFVILCNCVVLVLEFEIDMYLCKNRQNINYQSFIKRLRGKMTSSVISFHFALVQHLTFLHLNQEVATPNLDSFLLPTNTLETIR